MRERWKIIMINMEDLLRTGEEILAQSNISEAKLDAWYLMEYQFKTDRISFLLNKKKEVSDQEKEEYLNLIEKRSQHVPLQYITGEQEFMGLRFKVNENVLIPRQDTECLVEEVIKYCKGKSVLDLCTGSGCIAISLKVVGKADMVCGVDISEGALLVAKENAVLNQADISWLKSDVFSEVKDSYDIIVSNPPYIESHVVDTLMPEVLEHEPRIALDGSEDGLVFYRRIIRESNAYLKKEGRLFFEIGYNQGEEVVSLMKENGFCEVQCLKDLAGLDRVVCGKLQR